MYRDIGWLKVLQPSELQYVQALPSLEKHNLIVAGYADYGLQQLILFRGDGTSLVAAFSMFEANSVSSPDFRQLEIIDFGTAISLGPYEASTRTILVELDPIYKEVCAANASRN